eukprot:5429077-Pleurochrysis_carterae.AAC.2
MEAATLRDWLSEFAGKNASQQRLPFTVDPRVLYRGLSMSVLNMSVLSGVQFPITGFASKLVTGGSDRKLTSAEKIAAGFMGGATSGIICAPMCVGPA